MPSPSSYVEYSPDAIYMFNMSWTDNVELDTVLFECNNTGSNITASKDGNMYYVTLEDLAAGNYEYRWYANDTTGNWNVSSIYYYTINKTTPNFALYLNGGQSDDTIVYGTQSNASAYLLITQGSLILMRNQTDLGSLEDINTLAVGIYNYTAYYAQNQNYTSDSLTLILTVDRASPSFSLYLNGGQSDDTIVYGTQSNASAYLLITQGSLILMRNGTDLGSLEDINTLGADVYNYTAYYAQTQNYTSDSLTLILTVDRASPNFSLYLNDAQSNDTIVYGTQSNASAYLLITQGSLILMRNQIDLGSLDDINTLGAGVYNYTAYYAQTQNYTSESLTRILTINKATPFINLTLNGIYGDTGAIPYENITVNATINVSGLEINLYDNGSFLDTGIGQVSVVLNYSDFSLHNITANYSGNVNYTISSITHLLSIGDFLYPTFSNLENSPQSGVNYTPDGIYMFNSTWNDVESSIDTVLFEWHGENVSITGQYGDTYYVILEDLAANETGYKYRWYANDTSGKWNMTSEYTYKINKSYPDMALYLNGDQDNDNIPYNTPSNATAVLYITQGNVILERDNIDLGDTTEVSILGADAYIYEAVYTETQNYTSRTISYILTVLQISPNIGLYLNGLSSDLEITYEDTSNATAYMPISQGNLVLKLNGTDLGSLEDINILAVGTYNYTAYYAETQNYTSESLTRILVVNKADPEVYLYLNGTLFDSDKSIIYGTQSNVTATILIDQGDINLTRDRENIPSLSDVNIFAADTYNYTLIYEATQNYSETIISRILTVEKYTPSIKLWINGSQNDTIVVEGSEVNITATLSINKTITIKKNGSTLISGFKHISNTSIWTQRGIWLINATYTGDQNYSMVSVAYKLSVVLAEGQEIQAGENEILFEDENIELNFESTQSGVIILKKELISPIDVAAPNAKVYLNITIDLDSSALSNIEITWTYTDSEIGDIPEDDLIFFYWDGEEWVEIETEVFAANNTMVATLPHLSLFAIGEVQEDEADDEDNTFLAIIVLVAIAAALLGGLAKLFGRTSEKKPQEEIIDIDDKAGLVDVEKQK